MLIVNHGSHRESFGALVHPIQRNTVRAEGIQLDTRPKEADITLVCGQNAGAQFSFINVLTLKASVPVTVLVVLG